MNAAGNDVFTSNSNLSPEKCNKRPRDFNACMCHVQVSNERDMDQFRLD